jgi:hypothetical protein
MLEFLGPLGQDRRMALDQRIITDSMQSANVMPATIRVDPPTPPPLIMEMAQPTEPASAVAAETMAPKDTVAVADPQSVAPIAGANMLPVSQAETKRNGPRPAASPQTASSQGKRLNLRITRDWKRCPVVVCYRYHLVTERLKLPRHAVVDLAGLRLAPNLRTGVDKGDIDLLIEAVEHRKTINGRDTPIFIATTLAGVTPHDTPF